MRAFLNNPIALLLILYMAWQSISSGRFDSPMDWIMSNLIILPGIVIGLSFHEFAHAKVANLLGDDTPRFQGRVTLNPTAHIDPVGFIALLFIGFGWGKAVEVNPRNFKNMRRDSLLVDLAGVTMNLLLAVAFTGLLRFLIELKLEFFNSYMGGVTIEIIMAIISINIVLMIFNLLPIPPLDGFGIITEVFDLRKHKIYYDIYNKGFIILMVLLIFNVTGKILVPAVDFVFTFILGIFF